MKRGRLSILMWLVCLSINGMSHVHAEDKLIRFDRDIRPIFEAKCISCHGPDDAKNDFRVDISESVLDYIEPGSLDDTFLWTDYLITTDEDTLMPPVDEPQLTGAELAAIKLWIEEGAQWEEPADAAVVEEAKPAEPDSFATKSWIFQGLFHPVSVHLPVGLLLVSCFFLLLSFKYPDTSFQAVAFHCLWLGAVGAIGACVTGWAYAQHEGYGGFSFDVVGSLIDRHRWSGISVAIVSVAMVPLAIKVHLKQQQTLRKFWLGGSILLAAMVSGTGNWGGELIYGTNHYFKEFQQLFLTEEVAEDQAAATQVYPFDKQV